MRLLTLPGVFRPRSDSWMLADAVREQLRPGDDVLDLCTGSGVIAVRAAAAGDGSVTAVDVSRRAVWTAQLNARLNGTRVEGRKGDLFRVVAGRTFDVISSNPPYVPSEGDLPGRGPSRAWDAGPDGRAILDRICADAPAHLRPGGRILIVHSHVNDTDQTRRSLEAGGLETDVVLRHRGSFGPLMQQRRSAMRERGLPVDQEHEEVVIVRGVRPA